MKPLHTQIPWMSLVVFGCSSGCDSESISPKEQSFDEFEQWGTGVEGFTGSDASGQSTNVDSGDTEGSDTVSAEDVDYSAEYCLGMNPDLVDCDPAINFDPWVAGTGEVHYWIRNAKTMTFPFSTQIRDNVERGYFQITTGEAVRERTTDIFHVWFSETPNGSVLEGFECEWYTTYASGYVYWTTDINLAPYMCYLGDTSRLLYANFETRCHPDYWGGEGVCDDTNKHKSLETFQFDVSRRYELHD